MKPRFEVKLPNFGYTLGGSEYMASSLQGSFERQPDAGAEGPCSHVGTVSNCDCSIVLD